jgi:GT2 family glycosyltransferase
MDSDHDDAAALTSVIIPCWNALALTRVCLKQLVRWTTRPYELIIIDNASADGSGAWLKDFRSRVLRENPHKALRRFRIVTNKTNLGYPAAMNQGIRAARGALLLFGNNDVAVTPLWLENMQEALKAPRAAIAGVSAFSLPPRAHGSRISWGRRPWYRGIKSLERYAIAWSLEGRCPVFFPADGFFPGFWFLTRRSVLDRVGVFDERYGQGGFEDMDMQWRMRRLGYRLGFSGRSFVHHIEFGCCQMNGMKFKTLYNSRRARTLFRKFPQAATAPFSPSPEYWLLLAGRR